MSTVATMPVVAAQPQKQLPQKQPDPSISFDVSFDLVEPNRAFSAQTIGLIGPAGCGKSELMNSDKTFFLPTEPGLNHLKCRKSPPINSYEQFEMVREKLLAESRRGPLPFDLIVLDTIDEFVKLCDTRVIDLIKQRFPKHKDTIFSLYDYPASSEKGNPAWGMRQDLVMSSLNSLRQFGCAVAFIGHLDYKDLSTQTAKRIKETVTIGGQLGRDLVSWPDHFLNIECKEEGGKIRRFIRTVPTATIDAKSRGGWIPDRLELENPKSLDRTDMIAAADANHAKLRGFFQ